MTSSTADLDTPGVDERLQQQVRRVVAAARECPGNAGDDPRAALDQALHELGKGLLADQAAEHLDEGDRRVLVGVRQRARIPAQWRLRPGPSAWLWPSAWRDFRNPSRT